MSYPRIAKITVEIPVSDSEDATGFPGAKTKREAIAGALSELDRRTRMAELVRYAGTCSDLMSPEELLDLRQRG